VSLRDIVRDDKENVHTGLIRAMVTAALVALAATAAPAQGQPQPIEEAPLLSVETVGLEPTVGKTGDVIAATFRVTFRDLVGKGKEVLVLEDRMAPDKLPLAPFEAVGLDVDKREVGGLQIWDFVYRLRIVNPKKELVELRSVTFYWLIRDLGQNIEDAQVLQSTTDPLQFRYVTTITGDPTLAIRDAIELGRFARRAALFRIVEWAVAPLPLAIWSIAAVVALRRPRITAMKRTALKANEPEPIIPEPPTLRQARRRLRHWLRTLEDTPPSRDGSGRPDLEAGLVTSLRDYLAAELPDLNPGDTARDIRRHIETKVPEGARKEALEALAARMVAYQDGLEHGTPAAALDPAGEVRAIESLLARLDFHVRLVNRLKRTFSRSWIV
jgi:hypothetical protein